jgi:hypothetical protein
MKDIVRVDHSVVRKVDGLADSMDVCWAASKVAPKVAPTVAQRVSCWAALLAA